MENQKKHECIEDMVSLIPFWVTEGNMVLVEVDCGILKPGIILEFYIIDPGSICSEEYQVMIKNKEWLIFIIHTYLGINRYYLEDVHPYFKGEI